MALMKHFAERLRRWNLFRLGVHFVPASRQKQGDMGSQWAPGAHSVHGTTLDNISVTAQKTTQRRGGVWPLRLTSIKDLSSS